MFLSDMSEIKITDRVLQMVLKASQSESWERAHFSFCRFYLNLPAVLQLLAKENSMANETSHLVPTKAEKIQKEEADASYTRVFDDPESFIAVYEPNKRNATIYIDMRTANAFYDATRKVKVGEDYGLESMWEEILKSSTWTHQSQKIETSVIHTRQRRRVIERYCLR